MVEFYSNYENDYQEKLISAVYRTKVENSPSFVTTRDNQNIYSFFDELNPKFNLVREEFYLLDPIHVFSLINENNISQENRINNINFFFAVFQSAIRYESIDFTGIWEA